MLETLYTIDWSHVQCHDGWSEEIPGALQDLLSEDAFVRWKACGMLEMALVLQGDTCEASALALPFLLEILAYPPIQIKRDLVHLLVQFERRGLGLTDWYQPLDQRIRVQQQEDYLKQASTGRRALTDPWEKQIHHQIQMALPLLVAQLSDADPIIREEMAFLLGTCFEDASSLLPLLLTYLHQEAEELVVCALLRCLGHLQLPTSELTELLLQYLDEGATPLLQLTAARALCTLLQEQTPEKVVPLLFKYFISPQLVQASYERLSPVWGNGLVQHSILLAFGELARTPYYLQLIEQLLAIFPEGDERADRESADLLLRLVFAEEGSHFQPGTLFVDLTATQQDVLRALMDKRAIWRETSPFSEAFDPFQDGPFLRPSTPSPSPLRIPSSFPALLCLGLPATYRGMQAFLIGETAGERGN